LKKLQDFIKNQQTTPLIVPEKIDPEILENKIQHISKNNIERIENKKQRGYMDGSIAFNGTPTIRSIKKLNKNNMFQFKMKKSQKSFSQKNKTLPVPKNHLSTAYLYTPKKPIQIMRSTPNIIPKNG
jgi:S-adenosylmethionine:tRNA-ribosyltransferase-isomerase (queuine synthetase)